MATSVMADDDDAQPQGEIRRMGSVVLDEKAQTLSGIQTTALQLSQYGEETSTTGRAISLQPLLALQHRYLQLLAEKHQALAVLKQAEQSKQRQEGLFQQGIIAQRNVQEQQLHWQTAKASVDANILQLKALADEAQLAWGNALTAQLFANKAKLSPLFSGNMVLLEVLLPVNYSLSGQVSSIYVEPYGQRQRAIVAKLVSPAPQSDSTTLGQSYFFTAQGQAIRPGMRLTAWLPNQQQSLNGIMLPKAAGVWLMDQLFVYIKTGTTTFNRQVVASYNSTPGGYFTTEGFEPGQEVVTTGAQMLLSEEQRQQIPDEDD